MDELTAHRTLVKSPPELWTQVSDLHTLEQHLSCFGELRITRLEPETTVAWEGDRARGTVHLEPSGWGTKVTLTATVDDTASAKSADDEPSTTSADDDEPLPPPTPLRPVPAPAPEQPDDEPDPGPTPLVAHAVAAVEYAVAREDAGDPAAEASDPVSDDDGGAPAPARPRGMRALIARLLRREPQPAADGPDTSQLAPAPAELVAQDPASEPVATPACADEPATAAPAIEELAAEPQPAATPQPADAAPDPLAVLERTLDDLGAAHHRPFSRS